MALADLLPWLNLLLLPAVGLLSSINNRLSSLEADGRHLRARLRKLDGIEV